MGLGQIKKIIFTFLGFMLFSSLSVTSAQEIGTVDTRLLLILHPSMANYDYNNSRFFRDTEPDKNMDKVLEQLNKAQAVAEEKNRSLEEEINRLYQENCDVTTALDRAKYVFAAGDVEHLRKTKSQLEEAIASLKRNDAPGKTSVDVANKEIKQYEAKIAEIDAVLSNPAAIKQDQKKIEELENRLIEIDKKIAQCRMLQQENIESSLDVMYLNKKETSERVEKIQNDIKAIIKKVADKENCSLVIDNSFVLRDPKRAEQRAKFTEMTHFADTTSTALFHSFTNYEITEEQAIKDTGIKDGKLAMNHLLLGSMNNIDDKLRTYLQYKDYLPAKVADFSLGSIFLSGGKDLTLDCARLIFEDYKVPNELKQRYVPILEEYVNGKGEVR